MITYKWLRAIAETEIKSILLNEVQVVQVDMRHVNVDTGYETAIPFWL